MPILARILKDRGIVSEKQLEEAIQRQVLYGGRLGTSLYELGMITEEPWLLGWKSAGEGVEPGWIERLRIPLDKPSVFQSVTRDKTLFPIALKGRVVNLVYGDAGRTGNLRASLGELMVLVQRVPRAYARIIRRRVELARKEASPAPA